MVMQVHIGVVLPGPKKQEFKHAAQAHSHTNGWFDELASHTAPSILAPLLTSC